jgi:FtsZ-binding cell division protein ZapB
MYTHAHKPRDWYVCKSRTSSERQIRARKGLPKCTNPYMRREKVERYLDYIFAQKLSNDAFVEQIVAELIERSKLRTDKADILKVQRTIERLEEKKKRILNAYYEAHINRSELNRQIEQVKVEQKFCNQKLAAFQPQKQEISAGEPAAILAPLQEWTFLSRIDKRRLLRTLLPEIHITNYHVTRLALIIKDPYRDEINHMGVGYVKRSKPNFGPGWPVTPLVIFLIDNEAPSDLTVILMAMGRGGLQTF